MAVALGLRVVSHDYCLIEGIVLRHLDLADVGSADLEVEVVGELLHNLVDKCIPHLWVNHVVTICTIDESY